jgi:nicotinate-nucleotide adenylyltransferase
VAKQKIGLLGGSFNPAHAGHLHISLEAMKRLQLDAIWWLVSPQNPLKTTSDMAPFAARLRSAQQQAKHPRIHVLDSEIKIRTRYTVDTVAALQKRHRNIEFVWLMGADNLAQLHRWHNWPRLLKLVPIVVLDRAPYALSALHQRFAWRFRHNRVLRAAAVFGGKTICKWAYLCIPRHKLSASALRKKLGAEAFL